MDAPLFSPTDRQLLRQEILLDLARSGKTDVSGTIRRVTERLSLALRVARVSYWSFSPDGATFVCEDLYDDEKARHENGISLPVTSYPAYFEAIRTPQSHRVGRSRRNSSTVLRSLFRIHSSAIGNAAIGNGVAMPNQFAVHQPQPAVHQLQPAVLQPRLAVRLLPATAVTRLL